MPIAYVWQTSTERIYSSSHCIAWVSANACIYETLKFELFIYEVQNCFYSEKIIIKQNAKKVENDSIALEAEN